VKLPDGFSLRAPSSDDVEPVADVLLADDLDNAGQSVLDADFLRQEWSREAFDPATNAWVVADGTGTIVGYGQVMLEEPAVAESWGIVHPNYRQRGIGSSLLDRMEERGSELLAGLPSARLRNAINSGDSAAAALLQARGFEVVRHFWHMQIDLLRPVEVTQWPRGVEARAIEPPADLLTVHAVLDRAFADDWGYHPQPIDRWAEDHQGSPSFDPTLWLLATEGGKPVGALTASVFGDRGWVSELGVLPSHRGRGIGGALLRRSFETFAGRGLPRVMLNVDAENPTHATALYERAGMRVINRWDLWERHLRPDVDRSSTGGTLRGA
jgi:mycothiol synthase